MLELMQRMVDAQPKGAAKGCQRTRGPEVAVEVGLPRSSMSRISTTSLLATNPKSGVAPADGATRPNADESVRVVETAEAQRSGVGIPGRIDRGSQTLARCGAGFGTGDAEGERNPMKDRRTERWPGRDVGEASANHRGYA